MKRISKRQLWEYFILTARFWLAIILIGYSIAKLTGLQFYINPELLGEKVQDANLFQLSWFLADHQPFKFFIAGSQIIAGSFLIFNRTAVIGAFMAIPIWLNILIWDISFMDKLMAITFACRISFYLILTGLILWFYKDKIIAAFQSITQQTVWKFNKSVLLYLSLPFAGFALEFVVGKLFNLPYNLYHFFSTL